MAKKVTVQISDNVQASLEEEDVFTPNEAVALRNLAEMELRTPRDQVRYIVRQKLCELGLLDELGQFVPDARGRMLGGVGRSRE